MQAEIFEKVAKVLFNSNVIDKLLKQEKPHPKSISEIANIYIENTLDKSLKKNNVKNALTKICNGIAEIIVTQSEKNSEKKGGAPIPNQRQPGRRMEGEALVLILYGGFLALSMIVLSSMGLDYLTQNNNNNPNVFSFSVNNLTYEEALLINILSFIIGIVLLVICLHYYREYNRRNNLVIPVISSDSDEESQPIRLREVHRNNVRHPVDVEALFKKFRVTTREQDYIQASPPSLTIGISPREVSPGEDEMSHVAINIPILELPNPAISEWNPPSVRSVETMSIVQPPPNLDTNSPIPNTGRSLQSISSVVSLLRDKTMNRVLFQTDDITPRNSNRSLDNTSPSSEHIPAEVLSSRTTDNTVMPQGSPIPTPRSVEDMNTAVRDRQMGISFPNQSAEPIGRTRLPMFDTREESEISTQELRSFLNDIVDSLDNSIGTGSTIGSDDGSIMTIDSTNIRRVFVFEDFHEVSDDEQLVNNITIATMFSQAVPLIEQIFNRSTDDLEVVSIDSGNEPIPGGKRMRYRQSKTKKRSRKQKRTKRRGRNHRLRSRKNLRKTRK